MQNHPNRPVRTMLLLPPFLFLETLFIPLTSRRRGSLTAKQVVGRLVADAEAGARGEHAGGDVHGEELLEEQLGGIGDVDLRDARLIVAGAAFVFALLELGNGTHQSTDVADVHRVRIRDREQTLLQESRGTVSNHAITFHFSETQATVPGTTLDRLAGEDLQRSTRTGVDLVVDHMPQTLVVRRAQENLRAHLLTSVAVVHDLETTLLVAGVFEQSGDLIDGDVGEGCSIAFLSSDGTDLGK